VLASKRKKMCWNCDGSVSFDSAYCPYCGNDLSQGGEAAQPAKEQKSDDSLASLYKPPYSAKNSDTSSRKQHAYVEEMASHDVFQADHEESEPPALTETDAGIWPLLFLSIGATLLTLGLLLFFFSENGRVVLEWNAHYWFLYCLVSVPMLMMGYKFLSTKH
jgi:hypothetical protein